MVALTLLASAFLTRLAVAVVLSTVDFLLLWRWFLSFLRLCDGAARERSLDVDATGCASDTGLNVAFCRAFAAAVTRSKRDPIPCVSNLG